MSVERKKAELIPADKIPFNLITETTTDGEREQNALDDQRAQQTRNEKDQLKLPFIYRTARA